MNLKNEREWKDSLVYCFKQETRRICHVITLYLYSHIALRKRENPRVITTRAPLDCYYVTICIQPVSGCIELQ